VTGVQTCALPIFWNADTESFFHADDELERVNRIQPKTIRTEEWKIIADLIGRGLEHQVFDQHFLDASAEIRLGHKREPRSCRKATRSQLQGRRAPPQLVERNPSRRLTLTLNLISLVARRDRLIRIR